jgi:hypothetical protein
MPQDAENTSIIPSVRNTHTFHQSGIAQLYREFSGVLGMYWIDGKPGAYGRGVRSPEIAGIDVFMVGYQYKSPGMKIEFLIFQDILGGISDFKGVITCIIRQDISIPDQWFLLPQDSPFINPHGRLIRFIIR